jgi:hypothetical protein
MVDKRKQRVAKFIEPFVGKLGSGVILGRGFDPKADFDQRESRAARSQEVES